MAQSIINTATTASKSRNTRNCRLFQMDTLESRTLMSASMYLRMDGVSGESTDRLHAGWIELASASVSGNTLTFSKPMDRSSPTLMRNAATGSHIPTGTLDEVTGSGSSFLKYQFSDMVIVSDQRQNAGTEVVTVRFATGANVYNPVSATAPTLSKGVDLTGASSKAGLSTDPSPTVTKGLDPIAASSKAGLLSADLSSAVTPGSSTPMSANLYLKMDGVQGESMDPAHAAWIELANASVSGNTLTFSKPIDQSSPTLMRDCETGTHIPTATLDEVAGSGTSFLKYQFSDMVIVSDQQSPGTEVVTVRFATKATVYNPVSTDVTPVTGTSSKAGFSSETMKG